MKIKTNYVPDNSQYYLTADKEYEFKDDRITDDRGESLFIYINCSTHIGERSWDIVEENPFDIRGHEWFDEDVALVSSVQDLVVISLSNSPAYLNLNKADAISIAKAIGVTGDDLA